MWQCMSTRQELNANSPPLTRRTEISEKLQKEMPALEAGWCDWSIVL